MIEMQLENEPVEHLQALQVGDDWISAIYDGAFERLERLCQPGVASHLLTPNRYMDFDNAPDLSAEVRDWFGNYRNIQVEDRRVELVGERLGIFYRFLIPESGGWSRIEQQLFCTMQAGQIAYLHLLCSGFQPVAQEVQEQQIFEPLESPASPERDDLLVMHTGTEANGSTCALLTPAIKSRLLQLASGQVLEVRVDDPTAKADIEAWSRLSGNPLLRIDESLGHELRFFVQKK